MMASKDAPTSLEDAKCHGCRAREFAASAHGAVADLADELNAWKARALAAEGALSRAESEMRAMLAAARAVREMGDADTDPPPANDVH